MARHISYPSIGLFRHAVKAVAERAEFSALARRPKLRFRGSTKLHGVNAGIVFSQGALHAQSREIVLTPEADNHGVAKWTHANEALFAGFLSPLLAQAQSACAQGDALHSIALFGEWFGKGVQSGVGVSSLDKRFAAFGLALVRDGLVRENGEMVPGEIFAWTPLSDLSAALAPLTQSGAILSTQDFTVWEAEVDFEHPEEAAQKLEVLTRAVEAQCPVAAALGAIGIGEGIVWSCQSTDAEAGFSTHGLTFKVKGEKHSDTASKTLAPVDIERLAGIQACAELVGTTVRFEKALDHLRASRPGCDPLAPESTRDFIKWIEQDIAKEDSDTIAGNGLDIKDVNKAVGKLAVAWRKALSETPASI
jgi:hypothetical protein